MTTITLYLTINYSVTDLVPSSPGTGADKFILTLSNGDTWYGIGDGSQVAFSNQTDATFSDIEDWINGSSIRIENHDDTVGDGTTGLAASQYSNYPVLTSNLTDANLNENNSFPPYYEVTSNVTFNVPGGVDDGGTQVVVEYGSTPVNPSPIDLFPASQVSEGTTLTVQGRAKDVNINACINQQEISIPGLVGTWTSNNQQCPDPGDWVNFSRDFVIPGWTDPNDSIFDTYDVTVQATDEQGDTNSISSETITVKRARYGCGDIQANNCETKECCDDSDYEHCQDEPTLGYVTHPDTNNESCTYVQPSCDIGFTGFFLQGHPGAPADFEMKIPQWVELTNFTSDSIDLSDYWFEIVDTRDNIVQRKALNTGFIKGTSIGGPDSLQNIKAADECGVDDNTYFRTYEECEEVCGVGSGGCDNYEVASHGGKFWLISNSGAVTTPTYDVDNNSGVFKPWGQPANTPTIDFTQLSFNSYETVPISFLDFHLPKSNNFFNDGSPDYECPNNGSWPNVPENWWQSFDDDGSLRIILWNGNPETEASDQVCHLCLGWNFGSGANNWEIGLKGTSMEYNTYFGNTVGRVTDGANWTDSTDFQIFDNKGRYLKSYLSDAGIDLNRTDCDNDYDSESNNLCYDFGNGASSLPSINTGTPADINQAWNPDIIEACTDDNALNYVCNIGMDYASDALVCPYVPPYVMCEDGTRGEDSTCCQYQISLGCTDSTATNYLCDHLSIQIGADVCDADNNIVEDTCTVLKCNSGSTPPYNDRLCMSPISIGGGEFIDSSSCNNELSCIKTELQDCIQDLNPFPDLIDGFVTWCEWPFVIYFNNLDQDNSKIDVMLFNSLPIDEIAAIEIEGLDVYEVTNIVESWDLDYLDSNGNGGTIININKGTHNVIPAFDGVNDNTCSGGICTGGTRLFTIRYDASNSLSNVSISGDVLAGGGNTYTGLSISNNLLTYKNDADPTNNYPNSVIGIDTLITDCAGKAYRAGDTYDETLADNCGVCRTIIYEGQNIDYESMDGCWWVETGEYDGGILCDTGDSCVGCDGVPEANSSATSQCAVGGDYVCCCPSGQDCDGGIPTCSSEDDCGYCDGDGTSCVGCTDSDATNYNDIPGGSGISCSTSDDGISDDGDNICTYACSDCCLYKAEGESCDSDAECADSSNIACFNVDDPAEVEYNGVTMYRHKCQSTQNVAGGQCLRRDNQPCTKGSECGSGICVETATGGQCRAANGQVCADGSSPHANWQGARCSFDNTHYDSASRMGIGYNSGNGGMHECLDGPLVGDPTTGGAYSANTTYTNYWCENNPNCYLKYDNYDASAINVDYTCDDSDTYSGDTRDSDHQNHCYGDLNHQYDVIGQTRADGYDTGRCIEEISIGGSCCSTKNLNNYNNSGLVNDCASPGHCDECGVCNDPQCGTDTGGPPFITEALNPCSGGQVPTNNLWNSTCLDANDTPNGNCTFLGCTDSAACNTLDNTTGACSDGSCCYQGPGDGSCDGQYCDCDGHYTNCNGGCTCDVNDITDGSCLQNNGYMEDVCGVCDNGSISGFPVTDEADCYDVHDFCDEPYVRGCNNVCYLPDDPEYTGLGGFGHTDECGVCAGYNETCTGCMESTACNFNQRADDDGQCTGACTRTNGDDDCDYPSELCTLPFDDGTTALGTNGWSEVNCSCECTVSIDCNYTCGGDYDLNQCGDCNLDTNGDNVGDSPLNNGLDCDNNCFSVADYCNDIWTTALGGNVANYGNPGDYCNCNCQTFDECGVCGGSGKTTCPAACPGEEYCVDFTYDSNTSENNACQTRDICNTCGGSATFESLGYNPNWGDWGICQAVDRECGSFEVCPGTDDGLNHIIASCGSCPTLYPIGGEGTETHQPNCLDGTCDCEEDTWDCSGDCGGTKIIDCAGTCNGSNTDTGDCLCIGPDTQYGNDDTWCDDCANVAFGLGNQDLCGTCITPAAWEVNCDAHTGYTEYCGCDDATPCPANHTCLPPAFNDDGVYDWWPDYRPAADTKFCYPNWTHSCAPVFQFGDISEYDEMTGIIPVYVTIPVGAKLGTISPLQINLYPSDGDTIIDPSTPIDYGGSLLGDNCNGNLVNLEGTLDNGTLVYHFTLCQDNADNLIIGDGTKKLFFGIKLNNDVDSNFSLEFDQSETIIYDAINITQEENEYAYHSIGYGTPIKKKLGCIDPYAYNCNASKLNNCVCDDDVLDLLDLNCATYQDTSCTYPDLTITDFEINDTSVGGSATLCSCNFYDIDACETCLTQTNWANAPVINPLVEWTSAQHPMYDLDYELEYDFNMGLHRTGISHDYSISNSSVTVLNTYVGRSVKTPMNDGAHLGCQQHQTSCAMTDSSRWKKPLPIAIGSDHTGNVSSDVYHSSDTAANNLWDGYSDDEYLPKDGLYTIYFEWPWNWFELIDPLTGVTMTSPRIKTATKFEIKKIGCTNNDSVDHVSGGGSSSSCNYNFRASSSCGGDNSCCLWEDIFNGSSTYQFESLTVVDSVCCHSSEFDNCGFCNDSRVRIGGTWEYLKDLGTNGDITYYSDEDSDNIGCSADNVSQCIYSYTDNYYQLSSAEIISDLWPSFTILDSIGDEYCNCQTNIWDDYCDTCSATCSDNEISLVQYNNILAEITEIPSTGFGNNSIINASLNTTQCAGLQSDAYCVDGVCREINECGICNKTLTTGFTGNLDVGNDWVWTDSYRDCYNVCWSDDGGYGAYVADSAGVPPGCGVCVGGNSNYSLGWNDSDPDYGTIDLCGVCINQGNTCFNPPPDVYSLNYNQYCQPDSDGDCYIWEGGCYDCEGSYVGIGGFDGYDACCNCGGDCIGSDGSATCSTYFDENNNKYEIADCSGECGNPTNNVAFKTFDAWNNCCTNSPGDKILLYPDLDQTSDEGGSDCINGPYDGCSGELGFCSDFQQTNGTQPATSCPRCTNGAPCPTGNECPVGETCSTEVDFIITNPQTHCVDVLPEDTPVWGSGFSQPALTDPFSDVVWNGYYFPNAGDWNNQWDYCLEWGPDTCGDCWDDINDYDNNLDCDGRCPGDFEYGFVEDSCGLCYYPPNYQCTQEQTETIDHPCYDQEVDYQYQPNTCYQCRDNAATCLDGESHNEGNCNYDENNLYDCSGNNSGTDYSCCWYFKPSLIKKGRCEGSTTGSELNCEPDNGGNSYCQSQGAGNCVDALVIGDDVQSHFPLRLEFDWVANDQYSCCELESYSVYTSLTGTGSCGIIDDGWILLGNVAGVDGDEAYSFIDVDLDGTGDIPDTVYYCVRTNGNYTYPHSSNIVEVNIEKYDTNFILDVVDNTLTHKDTFSYSNFISGDTSELIWIKVDYQYVLTHQGSGFVVRFDDFLGGNIGAYTWEFPQWSAFDANEDPSKWYCPTPAGSILANGTNQGQFDNQSDCNNGCTNCNSSGWDWEGCELECVNTFNVYLDITQDVWNTGCSTTDWEDVLTYHIYWPQFESENPYDSCIGGTDCDITVSSTTGCMDEPWTAGSYWVGGACTCTTCYSRCSACATEWDGDVWNVPQYCIDNHGFYDSSASSDQCIEREQVPPFNKVGSPLGCCSGISYDIANNDCSGANVNCSDSCSYPVYGCMDDGQKEGGSYSNNQCSGCTDSVLSYTYKCPEVEAACDNPGTNDYNTYCNEYLTDNTCSGCSQADDCVLRPSPATNYNPVATYDDGSCQYKGCLDGDAVNYALDPTYDEYEACQDGNCQSWSHVPSSCVIPFNYKLHWYIFSPSSGIIDNGILEESENAHCEPPQSEITYVCSNNYDIECVNGAEDNSFCDDEINCVPIYDGGQQIEVDNQEDCELAGGTWTKDYVFIRKAKRPFYTDTETFGEFYNDDYLVLTLKGLDGWNCLGDDSGEIWDDQDSCQNTACQDRVDILEAENYLRWLSLCAYKCANSDTVCNNPQDPQASCGTDDECIPGVHINGDDNLCGTCVQTTIENSVWYPSEELPHTSFNFTDGLVNGGWSVEDGTDMTGNAAGSFPDTSCPFFDLDYSSHDNINCNIINFYQKDYGKYCPDGYPCDVSFEDKTYSVTITDPNDNMVSVTKTLYVKYTRNDYVPELICIQHTPGDEDDLECLNDDITIDINSEFDFIFPIKLAGELEDDPYYFDISVTSDTNDAADLNIKIDEADQLVLWDLREKATTGKWYVDITLYQPYPNPNWDDIPPSDLTLWYSGISGSQTISYSITLVDSRGPIGNIVPTIRSSFGISPDTFLFTIVGDDDRDNLLFSEGIIGLPDYMGCQCYDGSYCADCNSNNCPNFNNGNPCTVGHDGQYEPGEGFETNNPNWNGWLPYTLDGTGWNTVWKYTLTLYKCTGSGQCDENGGTAELIDGYPVDYADWSTDVFGLDSIPEYYYPPIAQYNENGDNWAYTDNLWTSRFVCPDGSYCGWGPKNQHNNLFSTQYCCTGEGICPPNDPNSGQACDPTFARGTDSNPCTYDCICPSSYPGAGEIDPDTGSDLCHNPDHSESPWVMDLIEKGHTHRFEEPGFYKVIVEAYDLFYDPSASMLAGGTLPGKDSQIFEVEYVVPIEQSLPDNYLPWQGINIPDNNLGLVNNDEEMMEELDIDGRKSLGMFVYSDAKDNRWDDTNYPWPKIVFETGMDTEPWNINCFDENDCNPVDTDFLPDVDIRTPLSLRPDAWTASGRYSNLFYYYDEELQPIEYEENTAPSDVQFYFYPRQYTSGLLFEPREAITDDYELENYYIAFIDWGDGSDFEFTDQPKKLSYDTLIKHNYTRPGTYEVTGRMFRVSRNVHGDVQGVEKHHRFVTRFNLNIDKDFEYEFEAIGGSNRYAYLPMWQTSPVVGGLSWWSTYAKSMRRQLGYIGDSETPFNLNFKNYGDRLLTEYGLAQIDKDRVGEQISHYTGSYAWENSNYIVENDKMDVYKYKTDTPLEVSSSLHLGFHSGSVDADGILQKTPKPMLISTGDFHEIGEFGDHLGEVSLGQIRFMNKPAQMYEMLGFSSTDTGTPDNPRYWNNIIPDTYRLVDRNGVEKNEDGQFIIDENVNQEWESGYYYPVLPKLGQYGDFTDTLQNDNIPFPDNGPITNNDYQDKDLNINISFKAVEDNALDDSGGVDYKGILFNDYKVKYERNTRIPDKTETLNKVELGTDEIDKPY